MALRPSVEALGKAASDRKALAAFAFVAAIAALGYALYQISERQKGGAHAARS